MALAIWNRPAEKARDKSATFPLTDEQKAARDEFARTLSTSFSKPGFLESLGAFVTPGNDEEKGTLMVALTIPMPAMTFTNPDGATESTRAYTININATIPAVSSKKTASAVAAEPVKALTYAELRAAQEKARAARK